MFQMTCDLFFMFKNRLNGEYLFSGVNMRKYDMSLSEIADRIKQMKGNEVKMNVNRGRRKIENYIGIIESVYPSIFTVKIDENDSNRYLSFSYSEVLCGHVKLTNISENK